MPFSHKVQRTKLVQRLYIEIYCIVQVIYFQGESLHVIRDNFLTLQHEMFIDYIPLIVLFFSVGGRTNTENKEIAM